MNKHSLAFGIALAGFTASLALAQGGGYGPGPGAGCGGAAGVPGASCPAGGGGGGYGPGYGRGMGPGSGGGTPLLTEEERAQHREKMHSFKTVEECNAYLTEHRQLMAERAKETGVTAPVGQRGNPCARMRARGIIG